MESHKFLLSILLAIVLLSFAMVSPVLASPYFMIGQDQWQDALDEGKITGMDPCDWADYMVLWQDPCEGDPYPYNTYYEPELYVYEPPSCDPDCRTNLYEDEITDFKDLAVFAEYWLQPCYDYSFLGDTGLVIAWGPSEQEPNNSTSSAWVFEYGEDPDLTNTLVTVTVNPPTRINAVSLGFEDINGKHMAWYWHCGPYGSSKPLSQGRPNMVTINTTLSGTAATIPQATGFFKQSGFDITHVQKLIADENNQWLAGIQVPPPGQATSLIRPWNYWYNMVVSPNVPPPFLLWLG